MKSKEFEGRGAGRLTAEGEEDDDGGQEGSTWSSVTLPLPHSFHRRARTVRWGQKAEGGKREGERNEEEELGACSVKHSVGARRRWRTEHVGVTKEE